MLPLEVLKLPLRAEEEHAPILAIGAHRNLPTHRWQDGRHALRIHNPAGGGVRRRRDLDLYGILSLQPADNDVELQRADDADNRLAAAGGGKEHLHQPFFLELLQPFVELLVALILEPDASEMLGRETRHFRELDRLARVNGVPDCKLPRVDEADDVARIADSDRLAVAAEEAVGPRRPELTSDAAVEDHHILDETAGADAHERHPVAVAWIHVRLDLEHEAGEALVGWRHDARVALPWLWRWSQLEER